MYSDKVFTFTFASGAVNSTELNQSKAYQYFEMQVPAFGTDLATTNASVMIRGGINSTDENTMIRMGVYSAGSGLLEWSTVQGAGGISVDTPIWGLNYFGPTLSTACTNGNYEIYVNAYNDK